MAHAHAERSAIEMDKYNTRYNLLYMRTYIYIKGSSQKKFGGWI